MRSPSHTLRGALGATAALASAALLAKVAVRRARRLDLAGKVVVVTGGSRGLGLLLAEEFGRRGARVAICGRDGGAVEAAGRRLRSLGVDILARACDLGVSSEAEDLVEDVAARWGRVDVLVNNAGVIHVAPAETATVAHLEEAMRSTFFAAAHTTLAALPHLARSGDGRLVNVTSIGARVAVPHLLGYSAAKFALIGFSEGLAAELGSCGVRVVTIVPGLMRTGSFYNAAFGGRAQRELAWFSASASMPIVSVNARRAARRIVRATILGERLVHVGWPASLADLVHGVAPRFTIGAMALVDRLLPEPDGIAEALRRGRDIQSPLQGSLLLRLGDDAARANNEDPGPAVS